MAEQCWRFTRIWLRHNKIWITHLGNYVSYSALHVTSRTWCTVQAYEMNHTHIQDLGWHMAYTTTTERKQITSKAIITQFSRSKECSPEERKNSIKWQLIPNVPLLCIRIKYRRKLLVALLIEKAHYDQCTAARGTVPSSCQSEDQYQTKSIDLIPPESTLMFIKYSNIEPWPHFLYMY